MITWPSIIKYTGEDELTFVASQEEWEADLHAFSYEAGDRLIDASGEVFCFEHKNNSIYLKPAGQTMGLHELTELIRKHASQLGSCCIAKISFPSVKAAVAAVSEMQ